jgi:hypothetical protein
LRASWASSAKSSSRATTVVLRSFMMQIIHQMQSGRGRTRAEGHGVLRNVRSSPLTTVATTVYHRGRMANLKRGRPKQRRAGCLLCKPHKLSSAKKASADGVVATRCCMSCVPRTTLVSSSSATGPHQAQPSAPARPRGLRNVRLSPHRRLHYDI